jgi:hypothetical protein
VHVFDSAAQSSRRNDALHHSLLIYVAANISLVGHVGRAYAATEVVL